MLKKPDKINKQQRRKLQKLENTNLKIKPI